MSIENVVTSANYEAELEQWRHERDDDLTAEDGWLTVVGLVWLREGENSLGSAPGSDVTLPDSAPPRVGTLTLADGVVTLDVTTDTPLLVDGEALHTATLRPDVAAGGPTRVVIGPVNFFIIRRADQYGVRVRDRANPARTHFEGRKWYATDSGYHVTGRFTPHQPARTVEVVTSTGLLTPLQNVGRVDFTLHGQPLSLEAFDGGAERLWFILKDATSGERTYGAGRFMYAPLLSDGVVALDFNRAYHPPCAFSHYATCPLPPRENILPVAIEAGERI